MNLNWKLQSGRPYTTAVGMEAANWDPDKLVPIFGMKNENRLPLYHRLDANVQYEFTRLQDRGFQSLAGISILNVYNRKNDLQYLYAVDNYPEKSGRTEPFLFRTDRKGIPFTPNVFVKVRFFSKKIKTYKWL